MGGPGRRGEILGAWDLHGGEFLGRGILGADRGIAGAWDLGGSPPNQMSGGQSRGPALRGAQEPKAYQSRSRAVTGPSR